MKKFALWVFMVLCLSPIFAQSQVIEVNPVSWGTIWTDSNTSTQGLQLSSTITSGIIGNSTDAIEIHRGYIEFDLPEISGTILAATIVLEETREVNPMIDWAHIHEVSVYTESDGIVTLDDVSRETILAATFETVANQEPSVHRVDITETIQLHSGNPIGMQIHLQDDMSMIGLGTLGSAFLASTITPFIQIEYETPAPEPTATPMPTIPEDTVIVTDDLSSLVDLSGTYDMDDSFHRQIAIQWNFDLPGDVKTHVYILQNEDGKPKYAGQTTGSTFVWGHDANVAGQFKDGPQHNSIYRFYLYMVLEDDTVVGPFTHSAAMQYFVDELDDNVLPPNTVVVTDDYHSEEDLSGGTDLDIEGQNELMIRWNLDFDNVNDFHVYAVVNQDSKAQFLGHADGNTFFRWIADQRLASGGFKSGPQPGNEYRFYVYVIQKKGGVSGPFGTAGSVYFDTEEGAPTPEPTAEPSPEPTPLPSQCLYASDYYVSPATGLADINLGGAHFLPAIVDDATPELLSLVSYGDDLLAVRIPEPQGAVTLPAALVFDSSACQGGFPQYVSLQLYSGTSITRLTAYDVHGATVATSETVPEDATQELSLTHDSGITAIDIEGQEIRVFNVCFRCEDIEEPTPEPTEEPEPTVEPTPITELPQESFIVTDNLDAMEDISGMVDVDVVDDRALVLKWNYDIDNVRNHHIYVLENETGKPKYLGQTNNGDSTMFVWTPGAPGLAGHYKSGPQDQKLYRFFIYFLRNDESPSGPFTHESPVFYRIGNVDTVEPMPEIPQNTVIVTDDMHSYADVSGMEDLDAPDARELAIRWNLDLSNVLDYHVYVIVNNDGKPKFLGRTGSSPLLVWNNDTHSVVGPFQEGPQPNTLYHFYVFAIRKGSQVTGPFTHQSGVLFNIGDDATPTPEPTETPTPEPTVEPTVVPTPEPTPVIDTSCLEPAEFYVEAATGLLQVEMNPIYILSPIIDDATMEGLNLLEYGDGKLAIQIPAKPDNRTNPAVLLFDLLTCPDEAPHYLSVNLFSGSNVTELTAFNRDGQQIASVQSDPSQATQEIQIRDESGISLVEIDGDETLLLDFCFRCEDIIEEPTPVETPTPEPTPDLESPVIVTDNLDATDDLSNGTDYDEEDHRSLVLKWNVTMDNAKDIHVYVLENETGKPAYLGRTNDPGATSFEWSADAPNIAGSFKQGPQDGRFYRFYVYILRHEDQPVGPFSNAGPVQFIVGEADGETPDIPAQKVWITDDFTSMEDLSGLQDTDPQERRQLVIRWNLSFDNVRDVHVYVVANEEDRPRFLGRSDGGSYLVWDDQNKHIAGKYKNGPQPGDQYQFFVYVLRRGTEVTGPFTHLAPVSFAVDVPLPTPTPTVTPEPTLDETPTAIPTMDPKPTHRPNPTHKPKPTKKGF